MSACKPQFLTRARGILVTPLLEESSEIICIKSLGWHCALSRHPVMPLPFLPAGFARSSGRATQAQLIPVVWSLQRGHYWPVTRVLRWTCPLISPMFLILVVTLVRGDGVLDHSHDEIERKGTGFRWFRKIEALFRLGRWGEEEWRN